MQNQKQQSHETDCYEYSKNVDEIIIHEANKIPFIRALGGKLSLTSIPRIAVLLPAQHVLFILWIL